MRHSLTHSHSEPSILPMLLIALLLAAGLISGLHSVINGTSLPLSPISVSNRLETDGPMDLPAPVRQSEKGRPGLRHAAPMAVGKRRKRAGSDGPAKRSKGPSKGSSDQTATVVTLGAPPSP